MLTHPNLTVWGARIFAIPRLGIDLNNSFIMYISRALDDEMYERIINNQRQK